MITLYDLVFQDDRRPSPFCWRAKFALKHKGLGWRDEPVGFTDKQKIAFAQSQLVPVIHDGPNVVKDSWAIALHLDKAYPDKPLFKSEMALSYAHFFAGWVDTAVHPALFPNIVSDLFDRVRPVDQPYFKESRGKRLGTTDFAALQAKGREKGVDNFRAVLEPARPSGLSRLCPGRRVPVGARRLSLRIAAGRRSRPRLARAHARPVRRHGPQGEGRLRPS